MTGMTTLLSGKSFDPERRRNARYAIRGSLEGFLVHTDGHLKNITFGDISKGGLSFFASQGEEAPALNSKVVLRIGLKDHARLLECAFKVRSRSVDDNGLLRFGLEVTGDTQDLQTISMLEDYIRLVRITELKDAALY